MTDAHTDTRDQTEHLTIEEVFHQGEEMFRRRHTVAAGSNAEDVVRHCLTGSTANYNSATDALINEYAAQFDRTDRFEHGWSTFTSKPAPLDAEMFPEGD